MGNTDNTTATPKTLVERITADTPTFFKKLRLIGIALAAVGGAIMASPIALPAALAAAGGYFVLAGSIVTAVSQITTKHDE